MLHFHDVYRFCVWSPAWETKRHYGGRQSIIVLQFMHVLKRRPVAEALFGSHFSTTTATTLSVAEYLACSSSISLYSLSSLVPCLPFSSLAST